MSEVSARSWLAQHQGGIPALDVHKQQAVETLENPRKNLADLADVIALDPGMSVSLFQQANGKLLDSGKPPTESVEDALAVLGTSAIIDLVTQHKTLTETHPDRAEQQAYKQLMSRNYFLLALVDQFISIQGIRRIGETRSAASLHNIAEFYACLFHFRLYQKYQQNFKSLGADVNSARPVFGFGFRELGRVISKQMHLPPLVFQSLENTPNADRRVRVIQFAADISHQAEEGWNHSSMRATQEVCAKYLNQSIDGFENLIERTAIASARACPIRDVLPAASRLVMVSRAKTPVVLSETPVAAATKSASRVTVPGQAVDQEFQARLKSLSASPAATRSQVIDLLLDHLDINLKMSRVLLLTLSHDKIKLGAHASRGLRPHSLLHNLLIDTGENRMFRSLLSKPLGLWVNPDSFAQYKDFLPRNFRNSVLSEDFFLMALFSGASPVGIIYCDRSQSVSDLDRETYIRFKVAMLLTSKLLGQLG